MTAQELVDVLASHYRTRPDHETISIGRWVSPGTRHPELPDFYADISITVGELKRMAKRN